MKILFVCSAGMSSTIVVNALKKEAQKHGQEMDVHAVASSEVEHEITNGWDLIMVAPQIRHRLEWIKSIAAAHQIPCDAIPPQAYTPLGGPLLWNKVQELLNK